MPMERDEPILAVESEPEISEASREIDAAKVTVCLFQEEPSLEKIEIALLIRVSIPVKARLYSL